MDQGKKGEKYSRRQSDCVVLLNSRLLAMGVFYGENLEEFGQINSQLSFIEKYLKCHFDCSLEEKNNRVILIDPSHEY